MRSLIELYSDVLMEQMPTIQTNVAIDRNIYWGSIRGHKNLRMEAFIKQLKSEGYDGIIFGDTYTNDLEFVVFKPSQIEILNSDYKNIN